MHFFRWLKRVSHWVWDDRVLLMGALVLISASLLAFCAFRTEFAVRCAGLTLELLGISVAFVGIAGLRNYLGLPSIAALVKARISSFPRWNLHHVLGTVGLAAGSATGKMRASVWNAVKPGDTLDQKVDALVKNVDRLREEIQDTQRELDSLERKQADALKSEAQARQADANQIKEQLKGALTNGLSLSIVGLVWIFVGVILATISDQTFTP